MFLLQNTAIWVETVDPDVDGVPVAKVFGRRSGHFTE